MVERMRYLTWIITCLVFDFLQSRSVLESSTGWPHHAKPTGVSLALPHSHTPDPPDLKFSHSHTPDSGDGKFSSSIPTSPADPKLPLDKRRRDPGLVYEEPADFRLGPESDKDSALECCAVLQNLIRILLGENGSFLFPAR